MTAPSLALGLPRWGDHGLSRDADYLRSQLNEVLDYSNTITIGERQRRLISELALAASAAQTDEALPMTAATYSYALDFVSALPPNLPVPSVCTDRDGDAYFEWDFGRRHVLSVAVGRDGTLHFAGLSGHATINGSELLGETIPPVVLEWIERVGSTTPS